MPENTGGNVRLNEGLGSTRRTVALMMFLRWWDEEPEDMTDERIKEMVTKWETQFMPSLHEAHGGDCTKACGPCVRCHTEGLLETAARIAAVIDSAAQRKKLSGQALNGS